MFLYVYSSYKRFQPHGVIVGSAGPELFDYVVNHYNTYFNTWTLITVQSFVTNTPCKNVFQEINLGDIFLVLLFCG